MGIKGNVKVHDFEMLARANQFKKASDLLKNHAEIAIPMEMNTCFACELYLKYLINFRKKNVQEVYANELARVSGNGHGLKTLYDAVGDETKHLIANKMCDGFESRLENVQYNFQETRYEYEYENVTFSLGFLLQFMDVLSEICNN